MTEPLPGRLRLAPSPGGSEGYGSYDALTSNPDASPDLGVGEDKGGATAPIHPLLVFIQIYRAHPPAVAHTPSHHPASAHTRSHHPPHAPCYACTTISRHLPPSPAISRHTCTCSCTWTCTCNRHVHAPPLYLRHVHLRVPPAPLLPVLSPALPCLCHLRRRRRLTLSPTRRDSPSRHGHLVALPGLLQCLPWPHGEATRHERLQPGTNAASHTLDALPRLISPHLAHLAHVGFELSRRAALDVQPAAPAPCHPAQQAKPNRLVGALGRARRGPIEQARRAGGVLGGGGVAAWSSVAAGDASPWDNDHWEHPRLASGFFGWGDVYKC